MQTLLREHGFSNAPNRLLNMQVEIQQEVDAMMLALLLQRRNRRHRRHRQYWVRPWITRRLQLGTYETLMVELERESHGDFQNFLPMEPVLVRRSR